MRNLLQWKIVSKKVKSDPTACEEFFHLIVEGHILCAVMNMFGMESLQDTFTHPSLVNFLSLSTEQRTELFWEDQNNFNY